MRAIRSKETKPERRVRSLLHQSGYRFRKNVRELPGKPDIVFPSRRKVIFVNGCFWHAHQGCKKAAVPQTREGYWREKLAGNVERDRRHIMALKSAGWASEVVWECELQDANELICRIKTFLGPPGKVQEKKGTHGK